MYLIVSTFLIALATTQSYGGYTDQAKVHKIEELPNYRDRKPIDFDQYAGHLKLPSNGQKMFYWYVESQDTPLNDPLILWLNGGPGCSSLGGFFTELGPFVVESDLTVKRNPYSWNRKANIIFLESPSGVGFSQPLLNFSYYNDDFTSNRIHEFLIEFLKTYPNLKKRDFYITGESYAGIYIPYLVENLLTDFNQNINLKGFAIGNPYTDANIDGNAYMDYFYSHALISMENYNDMVNNCKSEIGRCMFTSMNCSIPCQNAIQQGILASDIQYMNPYYIYGDLCLLSNNQGGMLHFRKDMNYQPMHRGKIEPCTDKYTEKYLNLNIVQRAIHVDGPGLINWSDCNSKIAQGYNRALTSLPKYTTILNKNLSALIYSGDADAVVNFMGTERWIAGNYGLGLHVTDKWKSWFGPDDQLAGYTQSYNGLTFKIVKGAGHMVPAIRPLHALYMFECFIYGEKKCKEFKYPQDNLEYLSGEVDETENLTNIVNQSTYQEQTSSVLNGWTIVMGALSGIIVFLAMNAIQTYTKRSTYTEI